MWENVYEKGGGISGTLILEPGRPTGGWGYQREVSTLEEEPSRDL